MKETDARLDRVLTTLQEWTWQIHLIGVFQEILKETLFWKSITERFHFPTDTE